MPDLTTAEMRERAEELRKLMQQYRGDIDRFSCVLDLALEALARREREEREAANGNVKCARCGYLGRRHFELDCFDHEFVPGSEAIGQAGTPLRAEECVLPPPSKGEPTFEERYGPWICCGCGLAHKLGAECPTDSPVTDGEAG
jgi:hypothetical protein